VQLTSGVHMSVGQVTRAGECGAVAGHGDGSGPAFGLRGVPARVGALVCKAGRGEGVSRAGGVLAGRAGLFGWAGVFARFGTG
jgi:hypothetical protein